MREERADEREERKKAAGWMERSERNSLAEHFKQSRRIESGRLSRRSRAPEPDRPSRRLFESHEQLPSPGAGLKYGLNYYLKDY